MTTLREILATNHLSFPQPLNEAQVDHLCLYLMEKLPIHIEVGAVEEKTWEREKQPIISRQLTAVRITQTDPQAQVILNIEDQYSPETRTRLYKGLHIPNPDRIHQDMQHLNRFFAVHCMGFSTKEITLLGRVCDATKAYFQEHF